MNNYNGKKIYIALSIAALLLAVYLTYSLIAHGSPLIKSVNERLISGNEYHKDSLDDKAMIEYAKAYSMDTMNTVSAYNKGTNLLMKNYQDLKSDKITTGMGMSPDSIIMERYSEAERMFSKNAVDSGVPSNKDLLAKSNHNLGLSFHHRRMLEEAEAAYKEALRKDPANEGTRYNLAVVQYLMKQQQEQQQNQQQEQQQDQQQDQQQNQQQDQQQDQQQEQQQDQQQEQQQEQQQNQQQNQDNKENYERMLDALMQDEKELRDEMEEKAAKGINMNLEKNW